MHIPAVALDDLAASLRTFAHAERFFLAAVDALQLHAEHGRAYPRDGDTLVPQPIVELVREITMDLPPGMNVTFNAALVSKDGTVKPVEPAATPPTPPPPLDVGPREESRTAGTLTITFGARKVHLRYDPRGVVGGKPSDTPRAIDEWVALLAESEPLSQVHTRVVARGNAVESVLAKAVQGGKRWLAENEPRSAWLAIDGFEGKAFGQGASSSEALASLHDDLFRARVRAPGGGLATPRTVPALLVPITQPPEIPAALRAAGYERFALTLDRLGLHRMLAKEGSQLLFGERILDRVDLATIAERVERAFAEYDEMMAAYHRGRDEEQEMTALRRGPSTYSFSIGDDGAVRMQKGQSDSDWRLMDASAAAGCVLRVQR